MIVDLPLGEMSIEEKLRALEEIWNDLCRNEENVPVPQWHRDLLDERSRLVAEGKAKFTDWESAKKQDSFAGKW